MSCIFINLKYYMQKLGSVVRDKKGTSFFLTEVGNSGVLSEGPPQVPVSGGGYATAPPNEYLEQTIGKIRKHSLKNENC